MLYKKIAIIGSSGAIGNALLNELATTLKDSTILAFSSKTLTPTYANVQYYPIDYTSEEGIELAASHVPSEQSLDLIITTTGFLHNKQIKPEKSLREISKDQFQYLFMANAIIPALLAKHFLSKTDKNKPSVFAALSARVGSISDNRLGGWYAYRASKAALNMIVKTASIEMSRYNKQAIIVGLHPGTVDSPLSKPFQAHVKKDQLFSPKYSAQKLLDVIQSLNPEDTGKCFAWNKQEVKP